MIVRYTRLVVAAALTAGGLAACQPAALPPAPAPVLAPAAAAPALTGPGVVDVTAVDYAFRAPEVIPSGLTTLRFRNEGTEPHMVFMSRLPEGKTVEDYQREISSPFSRAWRARMEGRANEQEALGMIFQGLPEWFPKIQFVAGPGIAAPGVVSDVTLELEPGNYVLECYIKAPNGDIHYMEGMIRPLVVSVDEAMGIVPEVDLTVRLTNYDMAIEGDLTSGRRSVMVYFIENPEQGFGHSVHVARLDPGTDAQQVVQWMNWLALDGLRAPAPAQFIGGIHPMPTGGIGYFTVDLEPGRYLFVSEATGAQGVMKEVTVH